MCSGVFGRSPRSWPTSFVVDDRPRPEGRAVSHRLARGAVLVGSAIVLAACGAAASASPLPVPSGAVVVRVVDSTFQPASVSAPSGGSFTLYFENADALPHDIVLLAADGSRSFSSDVFTGPSQRVYDVPALVSGAYRLHCDVHPEMSGTLTVP